MKILLRVLVTGFALFAALTKEALLCLGEGYSEKFGFPTVESAEIELRGDLLIASCGERPILNERFRDPE